MKTHMEESCILTIYPTDWKSTNLLSIGLLSKGLLSIGPLSKGLLSIGPTINRPTIKKIILKPDSVHGTPTWLIVISALVRLVISERENKLSMESNRKCFIKASLKMQFGVGRFYIRICVQRGQEREKKFRVPSTQLYMKQ